MKLFNEKTKRICDCDPAQEEIMKEAGWRRATSEEIEEFDGKPRKKSKKEKANKEGDSPKKEKAKKEDGASKKGPAKKGPVDNKDSE